MRSTRAIVDLGVLRANIQAVRRHLGAEPPRICLAVKADAYGHGIEAVSREAVACGVECLAVATLDEAVLIREQGVTVPILLYSLPHPREFRDVLAHGVTPMVCDHDFLADLVRAAADLEADRREGRAAGPYPVHIKVDTGMGRIGCPPQDLLSLVAAVGSEPLLRLEGISTHFASADEDATFTRAQLAAFAGALDGLDPGLRARLVIHTANSAGMAGYPEALCDMVRPGITVYGYPPGRPTAVASAPPVLEVRPVMSLESEIVFIKKVPPGTSISYGRTFVTSGETHIGTVPVGYGDGYFRALSNKAWVAVNGTRYPVVGRVCMDQIMIDLGPRLQVSRYDTVVLFGPESPAPTAADLAELAETISYEITCAVSKRVPRVYVD